MSFILGDQRDADGLEAFRRYREYLETERHRFPAGALALATSDFDWRFDEFRVNEDGRLLHEIEWSGKRESARWLVEAGDVALEWSACARGAPGT